VTLDRIVEHKRREVRNLRAERAPLDRISAVTAGLERSRRSLTEALGREHTGFVLECKRRAPSSGRLVDDYDPASIAEQYAPFADAISVLADAEFFGGRPEHVAAVSETVDRPVLWKDVLLEPIQVVRARRFGADAVLLMLSVLDDRAFGRCFRTARRLGMDVVAEVHDRDELGRALEHPCDPQIIGINNRNLETLEVDLATTERLAGDVPDDRTVISESGVGDHADVRRLRDRCDGFLVGSALTGAPDLARAVRRVVFGSVKVCGLTRPEDARAAYERGANWAGLIFADESPRRTTVGNAREVAAAAPSRPVGVFVDRQPDELVQIAGALDLAAVQLHGDEDRDYAERIRDRLPERTEIWQVTHVSEDPGRPNFPEVDDSGPVDRALLDTYTETQRGGTGRRFDWSVTETIAERDDYVLAGGLDPDCAREADALGLGILDVNSGVEVSPGVKSHERLERFFRELRGSGRGRRT